jgi:hypothetical protein
LEAHRREVVVDFAVFEADRLEKLEDGEPEQAEQQGQAQAGRINLHAHDVEGS